MSAPWLALAGTFRSGLGATWGNPRAFRPFELSLSGKRASNNDSASLDERPIFIAPCQGHVMLIASSSTDTNLLLAPAFGANREPRLRLTRLPPTQMDL